MKIQLKFIVDDDGKTVLGLAANVPLEVVFAAMMAQGNPGVPKVDLGMMTREDAEGYGLKRPDGTPYKRAPKMDATLARRAECPEVSGVAGGVRDMLSILSDIVAKGGK